METSSELNVQLFSHTFSPSWLMPLWKEAEMAVARIHGKVKCRRFKEKRRRSPFTKPGITGDGLFVSYLRALLKLNFYFTKVVEERELVNSGFLFSFLPPWKLAAMVGSIQRPKPVWVSPMNSRPNGKIVSILLGLSYYVVLSIHGFV